MADEMSNIERHTSYGRGGAGNLRRKSDVSAAEEVLKNSPPEERRGSVWERRSSIWSNNGGSRRASIVDSVTGIFRKNSKSGTVVEGVEKE